MHLDRRKFLKLLGVSAAAAAGVSHARKRVVAGQVQASPDALGVLVDTTLCVGCRKCEQACAQRQELPDRAFEDERVLDHPRRPDAGAYTVVNRYHTKNEPSAIRDSLPSFVKFQCMHCLDPACASACITGALFKEASGPVIYRSGRCIGCRYCMIACPFQIPAYEYRVALAPRVRKCTFCHEYITRLPREGGGLPACAQICPTEVMAFGRRSELVSLARWRIKNHPTRYMDHIFGEHEVGGTSWLYLASAPFEQLGFPKLGTEPPPRLTEAIQQGVFQGFVPPLLLFGVLAGWMWFAGQRKKAGGKGSATEGER